MRLWNATTRQHSALLHDHSTLPQPLPGPHSRQLLAARQPAAQRYAATRLLTQPKPPATHDRLVPTAAPTHRTAHAPHWLAQHAGNAAHGLSSAVQLRRCFRAFACNGCPQPARGVDNSALSPPGPLGALAVSAPRCGPLASAVMSSGGSSLLLLPSSSLLASFPCSVHGAVAGLPTSPTSSWSPSSSPHAGSLRMHALSLATATATATATASASAAASPASSPQSSPQPLLQPPPQPASAVLAHVLSSSAQRAAPPSHLRAVQSAAMAPAVALSAAVPLSSPLAGGLSVLPGALQAAAAGYGAAGGGGGQTIVFDHSGQAFILSPITAIAPSYQPAKPHTGAAHFSLPAFANSGDWLQTAAGRPAGQHAAAALASTITARSNTLMIAPQPQQPVAWGGAEALSLPATPLSLFSSAHFQSQQLPFPVGSSLALHSAAAQPLFVASGPSASAAAFGAPTSALAAARSPVPVAVMQSAFQPLPKRAPLAAGSPSLPSSLQPLSPAFPPLHCAKPLSPQPAHVAALSAGSRTPPRKLSAGSSASGSEGGDGSTPLTPFTPPPTFARKTPDSGGEHSTSPRIDGLSSSRLLTHFSKRPSHVLPFIIHRSQLPHNFDHLVSSAAASSHLSSSPAASDVVTVNIRVMGGPALSDLYFVAADISQLIHSRKSNIAKAVSVFTDDERARCSVVCPRSNNTQSTHILTVLTMAGVKRLLHSSRSTIALPLLAWLQDKVEHIVAQDDTSRTYHLQQHQQQQHRPALVAGSGSKRKTEDVKEDESDKRLKRD